MSLTELIIIAEKDDVVVTVEQPINIDIRPMITPDIKVILAGNVGPRGLQGVMGNTGPTGPTGPEGPQGQWMSVTQAEYDALSPPDPDVLYIIVG